MARIRSIKPDPLSDAEFVGLFNGEGHLDLTRAGRGRSLVPRVRIAMRDDDADLLRWCQERFGGHLTPRLAIRSICWQLTGRGAVAEVVGLLLMSRLPSKKTREALLMKEALGLITGRGRHISDETAQRLSEIKDAMKASRRYPGEAA